MAIEKKSLISTLKTTKKANVAVSTPSHDIARKTNKMSVKSHVKTQVKTQVKALTKKMKT